MNQDGSVEAGQHGQDWPRGRSCGVWPVVPKGGGVHGYVSGYRLDGRWTGCPHWYAGRCKRSGEPVGKCAVAGWGPGAGQCDYLEAKLLPKAPQDVRRDYRIRTGQEAWPGLAVSDDCHETWGGSVVERACIEAGQVVERLCPVCGEEPLAPRRRKCDRCRRAARRATKRRAQRRWRRKVATGGSV